MDEKWLADVRRLLADPDHPTHIETDFRIIDWHDEAIDGEMVRVIDRVELESVSIREDT
jgi:hypothetical protein